MKWTLTTSKDEKPTRVPGRGISRRRSNHFITALVRYTLKKAKQHTSESKLTNKLAALSASIQSSFGEADSLQSRTITKEELSTIQIQLAILSDGDGDRPIHIAVVNENLKLVQKLCQLMLKNKISLDITNFLRQTPLHLAVMLRNIDIIRLLLSVGASPLVCDRNGNSVLHLAVKSQNDEEVLQLLLSQPQVEKILNSMDYEGYSALHYATFKNNTSAVSMLHNYGADMNKIDGKSGRTALIHAVLEQNVNMVDLLLNCGACPRKTDYSGRSAYEMALQTANVQILSILEKWMPHNEVTVTKEQSKLFPNSAKCKRTKN